MSLPSTPKATPGKRRRGALTSSNRHWTDALADSEHATTRLGARFHLRKLFLRAGVDEFSQSELEFITQYLINETTIAEQPWWAALTEYEQLEVVNMLELHHIPKGEDKTLWFSSKETARDCILVYGNAEAKPTDPSFGPVLRFAEGSVVGNMRLSSSAPTGLSDRSIDTRRSSVDSLPAVVVSANASPDTWRRVKREQAFRNSLHFYNKLRIIGPADYFVLTSTDIAQTTAKAAERLEREGLLRLYGLERFLGCIRKKTFESGAVLAEEDEVLDCLYFILEGECRASVRVDDLDDGDPFAEKTNAARTTAADAMLNGHLASKSPPPRIVQLPIASLGPRSLVGDISMLLGAPEPATVHAVTAVVVLALSQEDYAKETIDMKDADVAAPIETMKKVALDTMGFVLDRVKAEAVYNNCDQTRKIRIMEQCIAEKQPELETPQSRHLLEMVHFNRFASYQSFGRQTIATPKRFDKPAEEAKSKIPSVVQSYIKNIAAHKSPRAASGGASLAPVILSKRRELSLGDGNATYFTREQRKAVSMLNGLHSPLANKSLGGSVWLSTPLISSSHRRDEDDEYESEYSISDTPSEQISSDLKALESIASRTMQSRSAIHDQLFLFPTMTRQRQLHARSLPLLPKYRAGDNHNR